MMKSLLLSVVIALSACVLPACTQSTMNKSAVVTTNVIEGLARQVAVANSSDWIGDIEARQLLLKLKEANNLVRRLEASHDMCPHCDNDYLEGKITDIVSDVKDRLAEVSQ